MQLLDRVRRLIRAVLTLGMGGTLAELLLISHYDASVRTLQGAMLLFLVTGLVGVGLHFNGAAEFQREIDPSQTFWQIAATVVRVHAPPLLAPGVMVQFGLLGLIYTYRHPETTSAGRSQTESEHIT